MCILFRDAYVSVLENDRYRVLYYQLGVLREKEREKKNAGRHNGSIAAAGQGVALAFAERERERKRRAWPRSSSNGFQANAIKSPLRPYRFDATSIELIKRGYNLHFPRAACLVSGGFSRF